MPKTSALVLIFDLTALYTSSGIFRRTGKIYEIFKEIEREYIYLYWIDNERYPTDSRDTTKGKGAFEFCEAAQLGR